MGSSNDVVLDTTEKREAVVREVFDLSVIPSSMVVEVTPSMAKRLLECNLRNRRLSQAQVKRFEKFMTTGEWVYTGDSITFDSNFYLTNGQHRLTAQVNTGTTAKYIVAFNVRNTMYTDQGSKRTMQANICLLEDSPECAVKYPDCVTIVKALFKAHSILTPDPKAILQFLTNYNDTIVKFGDAGLFKKISVVGAQSSVYAGMLSSMICGVSIEFLQHFRNVLSTGIMEFNSDASIIGLRDYLVKTSKGAVSAYAVSKYNATQHAIHSSLRGNKGKAVRTDKVHYKLEMSKYR